LIKVLELFLGHPILKLALEGRDVAPFVRQLGWARWLEIFFFHFPWSYGLSVTSGSSEVVSPGEWLMSSIYFFLPTGQVVIGTCSSSLPVCARWSDLMLFLQGGSCTTLLLQVCLVSSSSSKVWQCSFEYCPYPQETSPGIHHGPTLRGWVVGLPLLSTSVTYPTLVCSKFVLLPHPCSLRQVQHPRCPCWITNHCLCFSAFFREESSVWSRAVVDYVPVGVSKGIEHCTCCSPLGSAGLHKQLWNWPDGRNGVMLFSRQTIPGTEFSTVGFR
jgi:hypothetical protein